MEVRREHNGKYDHHENTTGVNKNLRDGEEFCEREHIETCQAKQGDDEQQRAVEYIAHKQQRYRCEGSGRQEKVMQYSSCVHAGVDGGVGGLILGLNTGLAALGASAAVVGAPAAGASVAGDSVIGAGLDAALAVGGAAFVF